MGTLAAVAMPPASLLASPVTAVSPGVMVGAGAPPVRGEPPLVHGGGGGGPIPPRGLTVEAWDLELCFMGVVSPGP